MSHKLIITAQYSENYAAMNEDWDGKSEGWKPKGSAMFSIDASSDRVDGLVYSMADTENVVKKILLKKSNLRVKYELIDIERVFEEPKDITAEFVTYFSEGL